MFPLPNYLRMYNFIMFIRLCVSRQLRTQSLVNTNNRLTHPKIYLTGSDGADIFPKSTKTTVNKSFTLTALYPQRQKTLEHFV